jgi:hypothetical protein
MERKCSKCGQPITDSTIDCPSCGHRVREERLERELSIAREALSGWKARAEKLRRFACDLCQDSGPCEGCMCDDTMQRSIEIGSAGGPF